MSLRPRAGSYGHMIDLNRSMTVDHGVNPVAVGKKVLQACALQRQACDSSNLECPHIWKRIAVSTVTSARSLGNRSTFWQIATCVVLLDRFLERMCRGWSEVECVAGLIHIELVYEC